MHILASYIKALLVLSKPTLIVAGILTIFFAFLAAQIPITFSLDTLFESSSPEMQQYKEFQRQFGTDDAIIFLAFKTPDVFSDLTLKEIRDLEDAIKHELPDQVENTLSVADSIEFGDALVESFTEEFNQRSERNPLLKPLWTKLFPKGELKISREDKKKLIKSMLISSNISRNALISADGKTSCLFIIMKESLPKEKYAEVVAKIRELAKRSEEQSGIKYYLAGIPIIETEYVHSIKSDLITFMPIALLVFALFLAIYFRNGPGIVLPLAVVIASIIWTLGLMKIFGIKIGVLTSIVPTILLVTGIESCIHVISRYQEELQHRKDKREGLAWTILYMVGPCFLTSLTTAIGFGSLITASVISVREFGWITAAGVMLAYIMTIQVLPSILDIMPELKGVVGDEISKTVSNRVTTFIALFSIRNKYTIAIGSFLLVLGAIYLCATNLQIRTSWLQDIRPESEVYKAHEFIEKNLSYPFAGELLLTSEEGLNRVEVLKKIDEFEAFISEKYKPSYIVTLTDFIKDSHQQTRLLDDLNRNIMAYANRPVDAISAKVMSMEYRTLPENEKDLKTAIERIEKYAATPAGQADKNIITRLVSPDWKTARLIVRLNADSNEFGLFVDNLKAWVDDPKNGVKTAPDKYLFRIIPTGKSYLAKVSMDEITSNTVQSLPVVTLILFLMMAVTYKSFAFGFIAMIPNVLSVIFAAAFMAGFKIDLNFSTMTTFSIAIGIAIDNSIHYLSRFRIDISTEKEYTKACIRTLREAGKPMLFATFLLCAGFASLLLSKFTLTYNFGLIAILVIFTSLFLNIFLMTALLCIFKPKVSEWEIESKMEKLASTVKEATRKVVLKTQEIKQVVGGKKQTGENKNAENSGK